jgi:hypothetical protein
MLEVSDKKLYKMKLFSNSANIMEGVLLPNKITYCSTDSKNEVFIN